MTDLACVGYMLREWKSIVVGKDWLLTRKGAVGKGGEKEVGGRGIAAPTWARVNVQTRG